MKKDFTTVLEDIAKKYNAGKLIYDDYSYDFIASVCGQYIKYGKISVKQVNALVKIAGRIERGGSKEAPIIAKLPDLQPGYMGTNCKTGDVWHHTWDIKDEDD